LIPAIRTLDDADINHLVQIEKKISNPSQMDDTLYECLFERLGQMFTFKSTGKQTIFKIVLFNPTTEPNIYSVTLGNLQDDASIDVSAKDGNGDGEFVLSTVAKAIAFFLSDYPEASIIIEGTTPIRTRLFQIYAGWMAPNSKFSSPEKHIRDLSFHLKQISFIYI
jgi:hypothetical protein